MKLLWRVGYLTWQLKRANEENKRLRACNLNMGRSVLFFKDVAERERAVGSARRRNHDHQPARAAVVMGLDITAYGHADITPEHEVTDACWDAPRHVRAFVYKGFERSLRGLVADRCYTVSGFSIDFRAGSYGGYNQWRQELCRAALGVSPETVWSDVGSFQDAPFFELIHFADNEGTIGPEAAADLAEDFRSMAVKVRPLLEGPDGYSAAKYDDWTAAFELAAKDGLVVFH
jgi:hypothetical protein